MIEDSLFYTKLTDLIRTLGHDMRAPLGTIISTSDMLAEGFYEPLTPKQQRATERIRRNSHRVVAMLDDFVTYVKAEARQLELTEKPFDPRACLTEWCQPIIPTAQDKGVTLHTSTHERVPAMLNGDSSVISRAVIPLVWNAAIFTSQGDIHIETDWSDDDQWIIRVRDSGPGIPSSAIPHIFEPFWRGEDRSQTPTSGAGLGLAVASALAKALSGSLILEHTGAEGSTFSLKCPCFAHQPDHSATSS
jgi:signal transduction histidine kinase